jgi:uncharacterized protein HemY
MRVLAEVVGAPQRRRGANSVTQLIVLSLIAMAIWGALLREAIRRRW